MVAQGEVYWVDFGEPVGSEPGFLHPAVIVQNDAANDAGMRTVIVCPVTSNLRRALPGAVVLERGEADLTRRSVVEVWSPTTLSVDVLRERIGMLSRARVFQVARGMNRYLDPTA